MAIYGLDATASAGTGNVNLTAKVGGAVNINSNVLNLQNTNTTTSSSNYNADIRTTSSGVETTTFLKLQLNGADIWIPYFTTNPSA